MQAECGGCDSLPVHQKFEGCRSGLLLNHLLRPGVEAHASASRRRSFDSIGTVSLVVSCPQMPELSRSGTTSSTACKAASFGIVGSNPASGTIMGRSVTVAQESLKLFVLVQIQAPQPKLMRPWCSLAARHVAIVQARVQISLAAPIFFGSWFNSRIHA